jgi:SAM-dependent methyltransferase
MTRMPCKHKAFSKQRWSLTQKAEMDFLSKNKCLKHITTLREHARTRYLPLIEPYSKDLGDHADVLDLACGAVCLANEIPAGRKVFVDPLLDFFRRELPGSLPDLPEDQVLASEAERLQLDDASFHLVLCLRGVSHVCNPEMVLHEVERVLHQEGVFIMSVVVWPVFMSRLYYRLSRFIPKGFLGTRMYCYSSRGIRNTLSRHFEIVSETKLPVESWFSPARESFFVCRPLSS